MEQGKAETVQNKLENNNLHDSRIFSLSQLINSTDFEHIRHIFNIQSRLLDAMETQKNYAFMLPPLIFFAK